MAKIPSVMIEMAPGELIDRITILEIKDSRIDDAAKRGNVGRELASLRAARDAAVPPSAELARLAAALGAVNQTLWDVEDAIRDREREQDFGAEFVALARSVYRHNDRRAALKREINLLLGSEIIDEKNYAPYE